MSVILRPVTSVLRFVGSGSRPGASTVGTSLLLLFTTIVWLAYLLLRFPFDGLYGQDSYAYYYQAVEIWHKLTGAPVPAWPFAGLGLYHWPVGYHLQVIAGFLLGGESSTGGRIITLGMSALVPLLTFLLAVKLLPLEKATRRLAAGLVSGLVVLFTGIFARTSLTLMSDVPALFWGLLSVCAVVHALPPGQTAGAQSRWRWALLAGFALGMAVLLRYTSLLLGVPLLLYALLWLRGQLDAQPFGKIAPRMLLAAALGFVVALTPQLYYILWQATASASAAPLEPWDLANFLKSRVDTSADGISVFKQPMLAFYGLQPLWNVGAGFLSPFYLPVLVLGAWQLLRRARSEVIVLLASWWILPVIFFSGTAYQVQRFVLFYMPPLALLVGLGAALLAGGIRGHLVRLERPPLRAPGTLGVALLLVIGLLQSWASSSALVASQAAEKEGELRVVELVRSAASGIVQPRIAAFGLSAAVHHYTKWPVIDIYDNDQQAIAKFFATSTNIVAVVPEASFAAQWAGTPVAARWLWLRTRYNLKKVGEDGGYAIYSPQQAKATK